MAKLKIVYSHEKEQRIAGKFKEKLEKMGFPVPDLSKPAAGDTITEAVEKLTKSWEPKEEKFIKQLNWFYDCNFNLDGWTACLSRFPIYPYWTFEKWFAVPFNSVEKQLKTVGHELFHQPFHLYWQEKCKEIFKKNLVVRSLKEALPELLNTSEFRLSNIPDEGHPEPGEQFIRHLIRKYYKAHGPFKFQEFIESIS